MSKINIVSGVACVSLLLATGAWAEILGIQPGTSSNPKDNVPKEIQRSDASGKDKFSGGSGPGTRGDALVGEGKEKPESVTRRALERNAEQGGGAATAAESLSEKSKHTSKKAMKRTPGGTASPNKARNDGPKADPTMFQQENSDRAVQGHALVNEQSMKKQ